MKKTMLFLSIAAAMTALSGQALAKSTILNTAGTNTAVFDDKEVQISDPSSGFYSDSTNTTAMYTLLAAIGNANGQTNNTIYVGGENTDSVLLDARANFDNFWVSSAAVYSAAKGASVVIQAKDSVKIVSNDIGILGQSNTQDETRPDNAASISIKAKNISITADNMSVMAFSNSKIDLSASESIYIESDHAVDTRGNSLININADNRAKKVTIIGDVVFETPNAPGDSQGSGNIINSEVNINLSSAESSWAGRAYQSYRVQNTDGSYSSVENVELNTDPYYGNVTDFSLSLTNGAKWDLSGDSFVNNLEVADGASVNVQADAKILNVDAMNVDNATVSMQGGADQKVSVNTLKSKAATLNMNASTKDGKSVQTGKFEVLQSVEDGSDLDVQLSGITADDIEDPQAAMDSVKDSVVAKGATIDKTIAEGDVNGAITETTSADGTRATVKVAENTKLASMKGVNAAALVAWRDEVAYTNQRMEFLRDHEHAYGAWGQVYGGESTYEGKVDLKTTTVQVGADAAVGDWVVGAAFSYMNGDADMHNGNADTDAYTVSLYTSRMFDSGLFVNGLARYGRLSTDATAGNMDGEYDNDAFSIGGNVVYRINFTNQAFVEPTFGLQYAYVKGDTYTAGNGVKVEQDDFDALIASLGARAGFNFPNDSGRLFARASVNHDFMGEIDGTASKGTVADSMYVDLGGTWFTYGVGAQFDVTKNLSFWGNIDRTTGGEVSTNYMMNAGLRYVF